ncbi:hypothetical protein LAZ67_15000336 [Cordylochernes scorpioides]|uniref:Uncharacterized protein n=1 Tax=Cordylochernes scorpioides TaxID=51811 RepID=A0ABY6L949_9ARAC|nr:hypothetical protein LAZ67_15000336 [Cordylochernes scorpioides]
MLSREIAFTRELHRRHPEIQYYYMGFYIHSCPKMRYKGQFHPSYLLCPETYIWRPILECLPLLDISKYSRLNPDPTAGGLDHSAPDDVDKVLVLYRRQIMAFGVYRQMKNVDDTEEESVKKYAQLVGPISTTNLPLRHLMGKPNNLNQLGRSRDQDKQLPMEEDNTGLTKRSRTQKKEKKTSAKPRVQECTSTRQKQVDFLAKKAAGKVSIWNFALILTRPSTIWRWRKHWPSVPHADRFIEEGLGIGYAVPRHEHDTPLAFNSLNLKSAFDLRSVEKAGRLKAQFVWSTNRVSWLPGRILARPVSEGGVGLFDITDQLRLACLKGVQTSLCGAANGIRFFFMLLIDIDRYVGWHLETITVPEIGSRVGRNQLTVMRICDRLMQEGSTDRRVRSHPPQCTTSRADRQIVRMAVTDRSVTSRTVAQQIQSVTHHPVSARTIRRRLQQSGLSARRPLLRLPLTQNYRRLRRQWCDERRIYVMHHHTATAPGIMVWGGIGYHSRTPLVRISSTLNSQRYFSERLKPVVLPYLQGLPTAIFEQDNARPHVARIVQRFFVNRQIELLPWPVSSPELSLIENMWSMVSQRFTQITSPTATPDQLWQRVEAARSAVPQEHIQSLFESMPRRVAAVISNNGGYSCY